MDVTCIAFNEKPGAFQFRMSSLWVEDVFMRHLL